MRYHNKKSKSKWQKHFLKEVFSLKNETQNSFSKIVHRNPQLVGLKKDRIPKTLFKFYAPTSNNILDIRKKRLWLSHPNSFNDPFDCHVGIDSENYEKYSLLDYIDKTGFIDESDSSNGFTKEDYRRLANSKADFVSHFMSDIEEYSSVIFDISRNKNEDFEKKLSKIRRDISKEVQKKVSKIREIDIRVTSFANIQSNNIPPGKNDMEQMIQMWAHYANNHKGFCVEYDISSLHSEKLLKTHDSKSSYNPYLPENNINLLILAGLFPIIYTSSRVNIPRTKLKKIKVEKDENLINNIGIDEILYKTFITKSAKWSYEKEWRIIMDGRISNYFDNKIPFPFIKHIYLGSRMEPNIINDLIEIADELKIEVSLMNLNEKKFALEGQNISSYRWEKEKLTWRNPLL